MGYPELLSSLPVFCNKLYWAGKGLKAIFASRGCDHGCANCKALVIKKACAPDEKIIFVGDGLSDRFAAEIADFTFAKGMLLKYCEDHRIPHKKYSGFGEITEWLLKNVEQGERIYEAI